MKSTQGIEAHFDPLLLSGIDSLYMSYYINLPQIDWEELHFQKERLKADRQSNYAPVQIGGRTFALLPAGTRQYTFQLQHADYRILLSENNIPNIQVQYASKGLWLRGLDAVTAEVESWIKSLEGYPLRPASITRIDFAYDFHVPEVDFSIDHFVSRASKDSVWRNRGSVETFSFGKGDIVVRVYDKVAEIEQQSQKYWLYDLWGKRENVWRVEFQVRTERLKKAGIITLQDLKEFGADLLRELSTSHTSLRVPNTDSNRSRWPLHPIWQSLTEHIDAQPQTGLIAAYRPENGIDYKIYKQMQSVYGTFKGLAVTFALAEGRSEPFSLEETMDKAFVSMDAFHQPHLWDQDIAKRMAAKGFGL
ncbi:hypothetical protein GCM10017044_05010 [Kordiimonas sediminis]|uniref:Replication initiation factor n=1 Tax=Kordiimonas sediminis TaxID=1735581 RepID=A0A919AKK9_9PROT|nr:replication initiation factor domain-containing protein [Kordiimonas sediminis]GHF13918.1 hypothetical protein GCM10017044_05010 [Kordiimonas sediminis]